MAKSTRPSDADRRAPPADQIAPQSARWFVYLIECVDGSIYTGIARDVAARYAAHACGKGARYTRAHPPLRLLACAGHPDRSSASKAEYRIKQLSAAAKRDLAARLSADSGQQRAATGAAVNRRDPAATEPDSRA